MKKHTFLCEEAIKNQNPQKMVDNTSSIARLANRVLTVAKQESDNSEDPMFIDEINRASDALQHSIPPMVQDAKYVAMKPSDAAAGSRWRDSNKGVCLQLINKNNKRVFVIIIILSLVTERGRNGAQGYSTWFTAITRHERFESG